MNGQAWVGPMFPRSLVFGSYLVSRVPGFMIDWGSSRVTSVNILELKREC